MKILLISSSPHKEKSMTFLLAKEAVKGLAQEGVESESIHLDDFRILFCKHCEECHKHILNCPLQDDVKNILKKILDADGIILASPNYINQITASMKALFDRSAHFIHCKRLSGKYVIGAVSSGSGRNKDVLTYLKHYAHTCGAQYCGGISSARQLGADKIKEAFKLGKKLSADIKQKKIYPKQIAIIEKSKQHFREIIRFRKNDWQEEYAYWVTKGWIDKDKQDISPDK